jgi:hypothetical protein
MMIGAIKVLVSNCITGVYLRWWFNGWHYFNFTNGYEIKMKTESMGTQVTQMFSVISKIERPTKLKAEYSYQVTIEGITPPNIGGFNGLLMAEQVMMLEGGVWREVDVTRGNFLIRDAGSPGYQMTFEIKRKELPYCSSVFLKSLKLYIGDTLCDMDEDEIVPINKQVNDIAEMQDRQSDFTATFKIRKTRAMKALFELSGETGIDTNFPFEDKTCRLVSDNIEIITNGDIMLDKVDEQYYYVSIISGNKNFFRLIEKLNLTDLTLASTNHTWDIPTMKGTHTNDLDYVYPLCEPSEDGTIAPMTDDGTQVDMYAGWIWPFIKVEAIWNEIFSNAGYTVEGDILTNDIFLKLFMPIINRKTEISHITIDHYSLESLGRWTAPNAINQLVPHGIMTLLNGTQYFKTTCNYIAIHQATYKFLVWIQRSPICSGVPLQVFIYVNGIQITEMIRVGGGVNDFACGYQQGGRFEGEVPAMVNDVITICITKLILNAYGISVTDILLPAIAFGDPVTPHINLPDITQSEFVKMICNMFGLIPDASPRDHKIKFWNYSDLYKNIAIARDWSVYLSERDDSMGFKFGDYAQINNLRYKESDDVIKNNGMGKMIIEDETLEMEKDVVEMPVSTCDEVTILNTNFSVNVSRIGFNKYNPDTGIFDQNTEIDARIVYVTETREEYSPPYSKYFGLRLTAATPVITSWITNPKKASSIEVSFSYLINYYASLSRLLTKVNLRSAKFNLPVYEVAGLKHDIPIYLSQYKAYFYVNKINNYVPGQLCKIDLIKL